MKIGGFDAGLSLFSAEFNSRSNSFEYSFLKPTWEYSNSSISNWDFGVNFSGGPIKGGFTFNPKMAGIQGVALMDGYAKMSTGQAPPTPVFMLIKMLFGK